jgi:hypothetical protein
MRRGLAIEHLRRQGAPPTPAEERAAVERYVDTEVMVREALALGLDRGDIIVRRRLVQKMEFLNEGLAAVPEPTDAELAAYLDAHPERYTVADRVALEHVFVSADAHRDDAAVVAAELRGALEGGADAATLGDPFLRGRTFRGQSARDLEEVFGPAFANAAMQLPPRTWSEPIPSSYGLHLVRITARDVEHRPAVDEVRAALARDWRTERRAEAGRAALARLRAAYDVHIEDVP